MFAMPESLPGIFPYIFRNYSLSSSVPNNGTKCCYPLYFWQLTKNLSGNMKGPRSIFVIAIDPCHHFAISFLKSLIDGIILSFIWFTDPITQLVSIFLYDVNTIIGRSAINNYIL